MTGEISVFFGCIRCDNLRYIIAKKKKAVPVQPKARTITPFAGSFIRLRDYQILSPVEGIPPPPTLEKG